MLFRTKFTKKQFMKTKSTNKTFKCKKTLLSILCKFYEYALRSKHSV